ncbi:hypothetical protein O6H91_11G082700 [Diphasiastrum complanatum]|uniref:Uncharacterized protein n=1 Tax=Diphasiastrum complanatum TaxID=34168 RepID=A0ACC2CB50_DIPCM|nr:hypothetical protein O6H91_11G082700 [Diphasiastrum complanatum]
MHTFLVSLSRVKLWLLSLQLYTSNMNNTCKQMTLLINFVLVSSGRSTKTCWLSSKCCDEQIAMTLSATLAHFLMPSRKKLFEINAKFLGTPRCLAEGASS